MLKYPLLNFQSISSNGFDFKIPDETIRIINQLASQVGSPTYIKTPNFHKKESITKPSPNGLGGGGGGSGGGGGGFDDGYKKKRRGGATEIVNDEDWENLRTYQPTKIDAKEGIIDQIRFALNKISDKNYLEHFTKITKLLDAVSSTEEMMSVSTSIFDIASNNRFYSKLYADLYTELIHKYEIMNTIFESNLSKFLELFQKIEYVDSSKDYNRFCEINIDNEKRKALSAFFVNLTHTGIISQDKLFELTGDLLNQLIMLIEQTDKKNEVDEISENIGILYNKKLFSKCTLQINEMTILQIITKLSKSKVKTFPSLTNKSIFKFMDILEA
jgi:hypothetical protein